MSRPSVSGLLTLVLLVSTAACASTLSEARYESFNARIDALTQEVQQRETAVAALPESAARDDELEQWQAVMRLLVAAKVGGSVAYLDEDLDSLERIEAQVDTALAPIPDLPRLRVEDGAGR